MKRSEAIEDLALTVRLWNRHHGDHGSTPMSERLIGELLDQDETDRGITIFDERWNWKRFVADVNRRNERSQS